MTTYKFQLQYFKESGTYYSEGWLEITSEFEPAIHTVFAMAKEKMDEKCLPGLMEGHSEFNVLVTAKATQEAFLICFCEVAGIIDDSYV